MTQLKFGLLFCVLLVTLSTHGQQPEIMYRDTFPKGVKKIVRLEYERRAELDTVRMPVTKTYSFDKKGRLISTISIGPGPMKTDTTIYLDRNGSKRTDYYQTPYVNRSRTEKRNRKGQLESLLMESQTHDSILQKFTYDDEGKLIEWNEEYWTLQDVEYDNGGNAIIQSNSPINIRDLSKQKVYYYDSLDRLLMIRLYGMHLKKWTILDSTLFSYYNDGKLKSKTVYNFVDLYVGEQEFKYNDVGQVDSVFNQITSPRFSNTQGWTVYTYDSRGYVSHVLWSTGVEEWWSSVYNEKGFPIERKHEEDWHDGHYDVSLIRWYYYY